MKDEDVQKLQASLNEIIGKLSLPAMGISRQDLVKECHKELIDLSNWIDDEINKEEAK